MFSAGVMSFTHGANDVSNAMGPFSAVYQIWQTGQATSSVNVQTWILAVGGRPKLNPKHTIDFLLK